ncbi:hypothetical protein CSO01_31140 [Cellulomonas soli]|uniref:Uncharacterized protein n=1 Tax=Cellulomonas soli TaxID=931535 RepID=A0A512PGS2_9CELL|nr:hypothetical protein CSO01_31140 [Cellulomonas soli]
MAAAFGPVVLFGEHRTGQADDRGAVGDDPHDVGAAADLPEVATMEVRAASARRRRSRSQSGK